MTELEKIEYARTFIDRLANGINPLDNTPLHDNDIANNVRLTRCFFENDSGSVDPIQQFSTLRPRRPSSTIT